MNPSLFTSLLKVKPFETIDSFHRRFFFENEKVINAFNRYATYIGSSPYVSPATFSLIGHLEMNEEVYYVQGGNPRIAEGFAKVFQKAGGTLVLNEQVIYEKLKRFDIDITSTLSWQKVITPSWIEKQFGAYKGALYGISANRKLRSSNVSKDVRGLYFVGGTTHPGGGSPMVTISGINVANLIST